MTSSSQSATRIASYVPDHASTGIVARPQNVGKNFIATVISVCEAIPNVRKDATRISFQKMREMSVKIRKKKWNRRNMMKKTFT
mmetsp:Transcript_2652/g.6100  ORF Transcript_2652/g.6100 Transcript_2652/m.6100 type:complete len:84 (-) Transcript_2652:219-470(-)